MQIGQRVICVKRHDESQPYAWDLLKAGVRALEVGRIYTIRDIDYRCDGEPGIRLEEIVNPIIEACGEWEAAYSPRRFRPVAETNIEGLKGLLAPIPEMETCKCLK